MTKRQPDPIRTVAAPLVLALHVALLMLFLLGSRGRQSVQPSTEWPALILLPEIIYEPVPSATTGQTGTSSPPASARKPPVASPEAPAAASEPPVSDAPRLIPPIDWAAEAHAAAEAVIGQKNPYRTPAPREDKKRGLASKTKPQFAWAAPRVQKQPGAIVIRLNDRCIIAISGFIMGRASGSRSSRPNARREADLKRVIAVVRPSDAARSTARQPRACSPRVCSD